jgi:hypothetical protein
LLRERFVEEPDIVEACRSRLQSSICEPLSGNRLMSITVVSGRGFVVVFSHVRMDGQSRVVFVRDFVEAAAGRALSVPQPLPTTTFVETLDLLSPCVLEAGVEEQMREALCPVAPLDNCDEGRSTPCTCMCDALRTWMHCWLRAGATM